MDGAGFESLRGLDTIIFSKTSRPVVVSTHFSRLKRPEREADPLTSTSVEVEENVTVPVLLLYALMAWTEKVL